MKVLHCIDYLKPGGAERVLINTVLLLHKKGVRCDIVVFGDSKGLGKYLPDAVQFYFINRKWKFNPFKGFRLFGIVNRYDIVHVHLRQALHYIWFWKLFFRLNTKLVFHDHYGRINEDMSTPRWLRSMIMSHIYIGVSKTLCRWAVEYVGKPKAQVYYLPNIVLSAQTSGERGEAKRAKVVMVSNFKREKNFEFLLKIYETIFIPLGIGLDIYGQKNDMTYFYEIQRMIQKIPDHSNIEIISDCDDISQHIVKYRLALHTAKTETGPLVLIEYLSNGIPFVAFQTGEVSEQLKQALPDCFVDTFDVESWKVKIEKILHLEEGKLSKMCKDLFEQYYAPDRYISECLKIYNRILQKD